MPLYEYQCDVCGHRFEVIQKFSDPHIDTCPKCGGAVHKLFSSPAIQFKGSGFYITDYARAGRSDSATTSAGRNESGGSADAKGESSSGDAKGESKSETKSETKSEAKSESSAPSSSAPKE